MSKGKLARFELCGRDNDDKFYHFEFMAQERQIFLINLKTRYGVEPFRSSKRPPKPTQSL